MGNQGKWFKRRAGKSVMIIGRAVVGCTEAEEVDRKVRLEGWFWGNGGVAAEEMTKAK
jgi:hypothetical protein